MYKLSVMFLCCSPMAVYALSFPVPPSSIEDDNYRVSSFYGQFDSSNDVNITGEARFPVFFFTGISISAGFYNLNSSIKPEKSQFTNLGLLFGEAGVGLFEANFGARSTKFDSSNDVIKSKSFTAKGAIYTDRMDVIMLSSNSELQDSTTKAYSFGIAYYYTDNIKISGAGGKLAEDSKLDFAVTYQPQFSENKYSFSLAYSKYQNKNKISLSASYYFDTNYSLLKRNRYY